MPRPCSHLGRSRLGRHAAAFAMVLAFLSVMPVVAQPETGPDTKPDPPPPVATASTTNTVSRPGDSPPLTDTQSVARQDALAPETTATATTARVTANRKDEDEPTVDETSGISVIINAKNPTTSLPRKNVAKLFLKKIKKWDDWDQSVVPVDQRDDSEQRHQFSDAVHGMRVRSIKEYWLRMIFSGRGAPPRKLAGDSAVVAFVAKNPGAIGYVSADTALDARVKTLTITD